METKGSSSIKGAIMAVLVIAAILIGNFFINEASYKEKLTLSSWTSPPVLMDINGVPSSEFRPGETVIIEYHVLRQPLRCWAVWVDVIDGPVSYQFPQQRSQVFVSKPMAVNIRLLKTLPDPLPPGQYHWQQMAFPTCDGREVRPFKHDTGIDFTVLPK